MMTSTISTRFLQLSVSSSLGIDHRMLIARAITRIATTSDDWSIIVIFAHIRTGSVSVGLNAVAFV